MENLNLNEPQIKEINKHIKDALEQWGSIMITSETDKWAYMLDYDDKDAFHAIEIMYHVLSNIAIKSGYLDTENKAKIAMVLLNDFVLKAFGLDTFEITENAIKISKNEVNS